MSIEQNKAIVQRIEAEVESKGNLALLDDLCTADFRLHFPGYPPMDREGYKQLLAAFHAGFPDLTVTIESQVAEGDLVANRLRVSGTHNGDFQGIPPTGQRVQISAMNLMRIENGKLAELWGQPDVMGMMQQLGVVPAA